MKLLTLLSLAGLLTSGASAQLTTLSPQIDLSTSGPVELNFLGGDGFDLKLEFFSGVPALGLPAQIALTGRAIMDIASPGLITPIAPPLGGFMIPAGPPTMTPPPAPMLVNTFASGVLPVAPGTFLNESMPFSGHFLGAVGAVEPFFGFYFERADERRLGFLKLDFSVPGSVVLDQIVFNQTPGAGLIVGVVPEPAAIGVWAGLFLVAASMRRRR